MKIAYISQSILPSRSANSIHVMKMCQAFAGHGYTVRLWGLRPKESIFFEDTPLFDHYGVGNSFSVYRFPRLRGAYGLYVHWAVRAARRWQPDIVYCRCVLAARLASQLGLEVYFEAHHPFDVGSKKERVFRELIRSPRLTRLVLITKALADFFHDNYPEINCETLIAPDGADPIVDLPPEIGRSVSGFQVGYVGQLHKGKGMEVIAPLAARCPWAEFFIVGGEDRVLERWKETCQALPNVNFLGYVPHSEVHKHILSFDTVLLPNQKFVGVSSNKTLNISDWTSPLKAFEYMAAGKPVVCSNLPVLREVFEDGINALLCDAEDVDQWARALRRLSEEPELRRTLGANAKRVFLENYTWSARARRVVQVSAASALDCADAASEGLNC